MADKIIYRDQGLGIGTILFVVFLILKLTDVITWSWIWVFAPLWIPAGIVVLFLLCLFIYYIASD